MLRSRFLHVFLFAVYPFVALYAHSVNQMFVDELVLPTAAGILLAALLWVLLFYVCKRHVEQASLVASLCLVAFWSYGHVYEALGGVHVAGRSLQHHSVLLPGFCLVAAVTAWKLATARSRQQATQFLNIAGLAGISVPLWTAVQFNLASSVRSDRHALKAELPAARPDPSPPPQHRPDIYYLVLDGFASVRTVKEDFRVDRTEFVDYLEKRGFYVAAESCSNYGVTWLSLASSLNTMYLDSIGRAAGRESRDERPAHRMIRDNAIMRYVKSLGYRCIHIGSSWRATYGSAQANEVIHPTPSWDLTQQLIAGSLLRVAPRGRGTIAMGVGFEAHRRAVLGAFRAVSEVKDQPGPKFVFAHILCPHPPYVFDRNGRPVDFETAGASEEEKDRHRLEQWLFTESKVRELVEELLSGGADKPVIIIHGDHGFQPPLETGSNGQLPSTPALRRRFGIFTAICLPNGSYEHFYPSISPVNVFRLGANACFGERMGLLPDRAFLSSFDRPYDFVEVTGRLREQ